MRPQLYTVSSEGRLCECGGHRHLFSAQLCLERRGAGVVLRLVDGVALELDPDEAEALVGIVEQGPWWSK